MVKISYEYKKRFFFIEKEKKQVAYKLHFLISFRIRPTRFTNIINTVIIVKLF